ncbi:MAG: 2Fe-2S iron-sulfur cluster binding domain-containing protein, partial [Hyphomicrobiales bacterium]|nr:2Fe-2S iron-sulfur cluster binding domain-containing protein [Hyphomicrobiales bacterium]
MITEEFTGAVALTVNGRKVEVGARPDMRLSRLLREELGLTGTKVGCDAGDCGACTVLIDEEQACACLVSAAQLEGRRVQTIEGLAEDPIGRALQRSFHHHGAAQCGICTPGMLMASLDLLRRVEKVDRPMVETALGGVLCRCTGYLKICDAVLDAQNFLEPDDGVAGEDVSHIGDGGPSGFKSTALSQDLAAEMASAVGQRVARLDGLSKLDGSEIYGADQAPEDALWLRAIRSPHWRAGFVIGDLGAFVSNEPGIFRVLTAVDVPGENSFGIFPDTKDQPVFAEGETRYRGEAVAAIIGERAAIDAFDVRRFPIRWEPLEPVLGIEAALSPNAH